MRILISGGSRGIGRACVEAFCKNGDSVAFIYKSNHEAAHYVADTFGATAICADISTSDEANRAVDEAIAALGGKTELVAVCDIKPERANFAAEKFGCKAYVVTLPYNFDLCRNAPLSVLRATRQLALVFL